MLCKTLQQPDYPLVPDKIRFRPERALEVAMQLLNASPQLGADRRQGLDGAALFGEPHPGGGHQLHRLRPTDSPDSGDVRRGSIVDLVGKAITHIQGAVQIENYPADFIIRELCHSPSYPALAMQLGSIHTPGLDQHLEGVPHPGMINFLRVKRSRSFSSSVFEERSISSISSMIPAARRKRYCSPNQSLCSPSSSPHFISVVKSTCEVMSCSPGRRNGFSSIWWR